MSLYFLSVSSFLQRENLDPCVCKQSILIVFSAAYSIFVNGVLSDSWTVVLILEAACSFFKVQVRDFLVRPPLHAGSEESLIGLHFSKVLFCSCFLLNLISCCVRSFLLCNGI